MTDPQKQHLFNLLMEGIYEREIGPVAYREMVAMTTRDLDKIEPVIDEWISAAVKRIDGKWVEMVGKGGKAA